MARAEARPRPVLHEEYCKGCGRCIGACARGCLAAGGEIHPVSGYVPIALHLDECNGCNLCVEACPEPYGLLDGESAARLARADRAREEGPVPSPAPARDVPPEGLPLPAGLPLVARGAHAAAVGAILAGGRHFFGYPITPSTDGAELMSRLLPALGGAFLQAPSEVASINMMFGCGAAGRPGLTFTSSPGFSLMVEGLSYMIGAELPGVVVNVMRAGPGLGNVGPEQADVKLACRGLGHGTTHAVVLAPATAQEMLDFTMLAFDLTVRYRNPVVVLADAFLGQMTGRVVLPAEAIRPGLPAWAVSGDAEHRRNLVTSIYLDPVDQEVHVRKLVEKYARIAAAEQRADLFRCEDAEVLLVACNTPAQISKGAVQVLRAEGIRAGLFRPQTLWPFPVAKLLPVLPGVRRIVVVEASEGQLEDELRLALSHAGAGGGIEIGHVRHHGGVLPTQAEVVAAVRGGHGKREARA